MPRDIEDTLRDLHIEIDVAEAKEEHPETGAALRTIREEVAQFIDNIEDESADLLDALVLRLIEAENALKERNPKLVERIRYAINFLGQSGV